MFLWSADILHRIHLFIFRYARDSAVVSDKLLERIKALRKGPRVIKVTHTHARTNHLSLTWWKNYQHEHDSAHMNSCTLVIRRHSAFRYTDKFTHLLEIKVGKFSTIIGEQPFWSTRKISQPLESLVIVSARFQRRMRAIVNLVAASRTFKK